MGWTRPGLLILARPAEQTKAAGELHRPRRDRAKTISISSRSRGDGRPPTY